VLAVSDTSPLNDLVVIEAVDVVPAAFSRIEVPPVVFEELNLDLSQFAIRF
jgi:predicted nucleic acid-binding protein